jgi:PAS domain S-box-containing protein
LDADGKIIEWLGTASDVTKRKEAEEAVRQSETRLWHFIDSAPVAIAMFDTEMRYLAVSQRWLAAFHLSPEQTIGRSHYELFRTVPSAGRKFTGVVWQGLWNVPKRIILNALTEAVSGFVGDSSLARNGGSCGWHCYFQRGHHGRKNAAEALRQSEERFRSMANAIPQLAWIARPDGYVFWFNQRYLDYAGGAQKDLEGWAWQGLHDPQVLPTVLEKWRECLSTGEPFNMEFPLRRRGRAFRTFLTRVMPLKDDKGRVTLWFGTHTDISERKQAEAEIITLRESPCGRPRRHEPAPGIEHPVRKGGWVANFARRRTRCRHRTHWSR